MMTVFAFDLVESKTFRLSAALDDTSFQQRNPRSHCFVKDRFQENCAQKHFLPNKSDTLKTTVTVLDPS